MSLVILDSGALTAFASRMEVRRRIEVLSKAGYVVMVPVVVLSEVATGTARDARLNLTLTRLHKVPTNEEVARLAGKLRTKARKRAVVLPSGIDALVAAHAADADERALVMTSDPEDIECLLADHPRVIVEAV